jgi:hypothetical protein
MKKFLALYMGSAAAVQAGGTLDAATRDRGMQAWIKWMQDNGKSVVDAGGPVGKTKLADKRGVTDVRNAVTGYVIIEATDHAAAAKLFENHPHFSIFPGEAVEIMECLPMPGG